MHRLSQVVLQLLWKGYLNKNSTKLVYHELVGSASATKIGHEIKTEFKIGCMVLAMPAYGLTATPLDQLAVSEFENKNYLLSDIHARGKYPNYIKYYFKDNGIEIQFLPGDDEI